MSDTTDQIIEDDPIEVRRAKRAALIAAGKNPYGHAFEYTHHLTDLVQQYADLEDGASTEDEVDVAGRVMAKRDQGKLAFLELRDSTGDIQLFCRINVLGEDAFAELKDLDVGDWIGVHGTMMRTKRGQLSVAVQSFELLSKSLRPLLVTEIMMPGVLGLGQGSWVEIDEETGIDMAGSVNVLNGPNCVGYGHQAWNSCIVKVEKWTGTPLAPDYTWEPREVFKED